MTLLNCLFLSNRKVHSTKILALLIMDTEKSSHLSETEEQLRVKFTNNFSPGFVTFCEKIQKYIVTIIKIF